MAEYRDRAVTWFAIGCYYTLIGRHDAARKHFRQATGLDAAGGGSGGSALVAGSGDPAGGGSGVSNDIGAGSCGAASAWLAFGHAFAAQDETDQAMLAYRAAARLFDGSVAVATPPVSVSYFLAVF